LAECLNAPDFMAICGGNGCGKSAILSALMTAKEHAGNYGGYNFDPRAISADAQQSRISMTVAFSDQERQFVKEKWKKDCPDKEEIVVEILRGGQVQTVQRSDATYHLLSNYSRAALGSPGFFDYIDAHRMPSKKDLSSWNADFLREENTKNSLGASGASKFNHTKDYLASLVMRDAQDMLASHRANKPNYPDSLKPIRDFFNDFFSPMEFVDVRIDTAPFQYIINTPRGQIDLDDMSAGEKEVLNTFVRFHQLKPVGAVILFDEADAHLHPDLERRYLQVLRRIGEGNQLWLTTHSPEMMMAAGSESLYTVLKEPPKNNGNQFVRVTSNELLHSALSEVMGSRGLVSFNQRIIFIEGEESSADREVYEKLYPPGAYHVSFVPAGNSATIRKTAERINELLSSAIEFQHYYSIVDGDIDRSLPAPIPAGSTRLFQLPVYHVENFLLVDKLIFDVAKSMMSLKCPYGSEADVKTALEQIVLSPNHLKPFARAMQDARLAKAAKIAWDGVFKGSAPIAQSIPSFAQTESDAQTEMQKAISDGTWRDRCKAREVLKAFCGINSLTYEHFRNLVIAKLEAPPAALAAIMNQILA
jgi:predicted ATPase